MVLAGVGASLAPLAGCALVSPSGRTPSASAPPPTPDAAHAALASVHAALAAAHAVEPDAARLALFAWGLSVVGEQAAAVAITLPGVAPRTATPTATPPDASGPATPSPSAAPHLDAVRTALASAAPRFRTRALAPETAQPLVWASMGAWSEAMGASLDRPDTPREPARDRVPPPAQTVVEATQAATATVADVVYGLQTAGGAPGLSPADLDRIRARVVFWLRLRDDLRSAVGPSPSPTPTPGPVWHQVPRPADAAAAAALVVSLESSALPILGRSLAFGPDAVRARLVDALGGVAAGLPSWGGPLLRWPGWPA